MAEPPQSAALLKLATWLSPAYPVGAFSYSHGLEWVVSAGDVTSADALEAWLSAILLHGAGRTDAILLAHAWRAAGDADSAKLTEIAELGAALFPSAERRLEAMDQGASFMRVSGAVWPADGSLPEEMPHAVAVGAYAGAHAVPLPATLEFYLHAFASNLVSAAIRLVPLGQTEGQQVLADLAETIIGVAHDAIDADMDDIGGCAFRADLASMAHETLHTRLFRS